MTGGQLLPENNRHTFRLDRLPPRRELYLDFRQRDRREGDDPAVLVAGIDTAALGSAVEILRLSWSGARASHLIGSVRTITATVTLQIAGMTLPPHTGM
jgi:hypothetical protein